MASNIPAALFSLFQMMFASITPLIMTGAYAERLRWDVFLVFTVVWEVNPETVEPLNPTPDPRLLPGLPLIPKP
jgi:hypothetical protein